MSVSAGRRNKVIKLQSPGGARDAVGWIDREWTTEATVYASIEPLSGRERLLADQLQAETTHRITLRYSSSVASLDSSWRVLYGTRAFVIESARNVEENNRAIELLCVERIMPEESLPAGARLTVGAGYRVTSGGAYRVRA